MLAVPSAVAPTEAYVVTGGLERHRRWHRVDVTTGTELETHDLRMETTAAVDISGDGTRSAFTGDFLRVREHTGDLLWRRKGGWRDARFVDGDTRLLSWMSNGTVVELDAHTGEEVYRVRGYPPVAVAGRFLGLSLGRGQLGLVDRATGELVARWPGIASAVLPWRGGLLALSGALWFVVPGERGPQWTVPTAASGRLVATADAVLVVGPDAAYAHVADDPASRTGLPVPSGEFRLTADGSRAAVQHGNAYWGWTHDGEVGRTGNHESPVQTVAADPAGAWLATFANDRAIRIWSGDTPVRAVPVGYGPRHLTVDATSVTAGSWNAIHRFDPRTGGQLPLTDPFPADAVDHWQYSPDGTLFWVVERVGSWDRRGTLIRRADGTVLWQGEVTAGTAGFGADTVVLLTRTGLLHVYALPAPPASRQPGGGQPGGGQPGGGQPGGGQPGGGQPGGGQPDGGQRGDTDGGQLSDGHELPVVLAHRGWLDRPAFDATASRLARYTSKGLIEVHDTHTGAELGSVDLRTDGSPVFAGPDRLVVLDQNHRLHVLAVPGLEPVEVLTPPDARSVHAAPGPDFYVATARGVLLRYRP